MKKPVTGRTVFGTHPGGEEQQDEGVLGCFHGENGLNET